MSVIFFPGKFQPPHIGHVMTISNLLSIAYTVVVGVTEGGPRIMSREKTIYILKKAFSHLSLSELKVVPIDGTLTEYTNIDGLPHFDVLYTGNKDVMKWAEKMGIKYKYAPRSEGIGCSGTELRKLCDKSG